MVLIVSPRLDRPSAVGDEGRPRAVSLAAATLVAALYGAGVVHLLGIWELVRAVALGVGLVVAGVALIDRDDRVAPVVGLVCFLFGGLLVVGGLVAASLWGRATGLVVAALAVALFGVGGAWADAVGRGRVTAAGEDAAVTVGLLMVAAFVIPLVGGGLLLLSRLFGTVVLPRGNPGIGGLLLLVGLAALAVRLALPRLPVAELAPRERRDELDRHRDRARRVAAWLAVAGLVGWTTVLLAGPLGVRTGVTFDSAVATVLVGAPLRVALAFVALAALAGAVAAGVARRLAGVDPRESQLVGQLVAGLAMLVVPVPVLAWIAVGLGRAVPGLLFLAALALALVVLGILAFLLVLAAVPAAAGLGLLPDRAAPLALLAAGLLGVALAAGVGGAPAPVVFLGVGAATFAWDVSEFGLGLTAELGHLPDARRVELVHCVASAGVALAGVALAAGLLAVVRAVGPGVGAPLPATGFAFVGTVLLLAALRA